MRISTFKLIGLIILSGHFSFGFGQNRVDSLRTILDMKNIPDSTYMRVSVDLCKVLVNTDHEYLLADYAVKALEKDTLQQDFRSRVELYQYLGTYYWQVGMLNESAEEFNQMRLIGERKSDPLIIANSYIGLGTVYYLMVDYEMAMDYYRKGLALSNTDSLMTARLYTNIANTFVQQGKMDSVLIYYNKSADFHKSHQNHRNLSIIYGNIALFYSRLGNGPEVRKYVNLSLESAKRLNDPYQIASAYQTMGSLAFNQHPAMAIKNFTMSLDLAEKNKSYDQIRFCLENLAYLTQQRGNDQAAIDYLQRIVDLDDSLDLVQKKDRIKQMELEHLAVVRSSEELVKTQQLELKQIREKNQQKFVLILLLIAFATLLTLFFMGVYNYRMKMKVTHTKERFVSMIAHDIRNPFSGILGLSGILVEEADKNDDPVQRKQVRALNQSLHQVYDLLENMLQWSHSESGKISFNPKVQPLSPLVQNAISLHTQTSKQKGIALENQVQSGLTARYDSNMLQTVIRNLLSNALKFSRENSTIFVSAEVVGKEVVVKVSDQGIGMSQEQLDRMFKDEVGISTMGTRNEIGSGLGLIICKDFIRRHGGRIWAESKLHEGTTMYFSLPDQHRRV